jgi:hypothetical protein
MSRTVLEFGIPASLATAYQVKPLASRAARICDGTPGGDSARPAPGADGNSSITFARISACRFRYSAVAGRMIRLISCFAIDSPSSGPRGRRPFLGRPVSPVSRGSSLNDPKIHRDQQGFNRRQFELALSLEEFVDRGLG